MFQYSNTTNKQLALKHTKKREKVVRQKSWDVGSKKFIILGLMSRNSTIILIYASSNTDLRSADNNLIIAKQRASIKKKKKKVSKALIFQYVANFFRGETIERCKPPRENRKKSLP